MKTLILTASLIATVIVGAVGAQAAGFDGNALFAEIARASSNH